MKTLHFSIVGTSAMLHHSDALADPLNPLSKSVSEIAKKRSKTDDDHAEVSRREWLGGRYLLDDGRPCVPAAMLRKALIEGARKVKLGKQVAAGVLFSEPGFPIILDGIDRSADELFADPRFVDRRTVGVQGRRVVRTRPRYAKGWRVDFYVDIDEETVDEAVVENALSMAGRVIGIGDYRPLHGRFELVA